MNQSFVLLTLAAAVQASVKIMTPPYSATGSEIAIVWVGGAHYDASDYMSIALAFQQAAAAQGLKAWVGIPQFTFDIPKPKLLDGSIQDSVKQLKAAGYTGDEWFLAAHSLGGFMAQDFLTNGAIDSTLFKAQALMGSVLDRKKVSIQ
jgi:alpha-beta hydrolase superfamily lysophospholipase